LATGLRNMEEHSNPNLHTRQGLREDNLQDHDDPPTKPEAPRKPVKARCVDLMEEGYIYEPPFY